jgi:hypothetical protein
MVIQLLLCGGVGWSLHSLWERRWVLNKVGRSYSWRGYCLQVCAACPTVLFCKCVLPAKLYCFASVCCLPNCIVLQVCAACPTVLFCKCVLPVQLYYLQVCAACPTVLFCKCVLPAQHPILFRRVRTPSIPENNIQKTFSTGTWPDTTLYIYSVYLLMMGNIYPQHVEVEWRNKLTINSASGWFSLQRLSRFTVSKT